MERGAAHIHQESISGFNSFPQFPSGSLSVNRITKFDPSSARR